MAFALKSDLELLELFNDIATYKNFTNQQLFVIMMTSLRSLIDSSDFRATEVHCLRSIALSAQASSFAHRFQMYTVHVEAA